MTAKPIIYGIHPAPPQLTPKYRAMAPRIRQGECAADHDPGKGFQNLVRLRWDRPAPTLTKMNPGNGRGTPLHPTAHRSLTIEEALRIGGFPDDFKMAGTFADRWGRIGNSVPPPLMEAVAEHVRRIALQSDRPTVVSTFAGCGGSSLGYKMAGYECKLAVEWDDNAAETYRLNFPQTTLFHGDIAKLSDEMALRMSGLRQGELDVFDGSPPCQGFSTAGKRQIDDPRNQLFREYVRLLRAFRPRAFVMENVSGMVKGHMRTLFAEILGDLKSCGYVVRARLLNAAWYGVPQSRERMIFIGVREDLGVDPTHPSPTVRRATTVRQVLPELSGQRFLTWRGRGRRDRVTEPGALAPTITKGGAWR